MKIVSLFSGAGGLDLGLIKAGHRVIWANDIDTNAVETYRRNIGDHILCADIKNVNMRDIPDGSFPRYIGKRRLSIRESAAMLTIPDGFEGVDASNKGVLLEAA